MTALGQKNENAEETQLKQIEVIEVSATKRTTGLQDTPIAITALSGESLEKRNVVDISQLQDFTPSLVFDTTAPVSGLSSGAVVFIRGVGQTDFQLTTDPGVGTYIDGVYASRSAGGVMDVLDLERVEVLRGPQGTLFGRNAIGGAISLVSRAPAEEFGGNISATLGNFDRRDVKGAIDIPLSDKVLSRISFSSRNQDGFMRGLLDDRELGNINRDAFRASLKWTPTNDLTIDFVFDGSQIDEQNAASKLVGITITPPGATERTDFVYNRSTGGVDILTNPAVPGPPSLAYLYNVVDATFSDIPGFGLVPFDQRWITSDLDTTFATGPNGTQMDNLGASATIEWIGEDITIKSITAYRDTHGQFNRDADGSPLAMGHTQNSDYDHEQFSQELQFLGDALDGDLEWVAGLFYFDESGNDVLDVRLPQAFGVVRNYAFIENESIAAFSQFNYFASDNLSLVAGIRYTEDDKSYFVPNEGGAVVNGVLGFFGEPGTITPFFPPGEYNETFDDVSIKLGADYELASGSLIYGSFSQGFKSGGFNTRYLVPVPEAVPFEPETLDTFELGYKWRSDNGRMQANVAAYTSDYQDIQLIVYEGGAPLTRNAGSATIRGVEAEFISLIGDNLEINGSLGYINAEYDKVAPLDPALPQDQQVTLDSELPNTPELTVALAMDYEMQFGDSLLDFHIDWRYVSSIQNDAINSPFLAQGSTHVMNGGITYHFGQSYELTLFGENLTDERFIISGDSNFGVGFHEANFNRPRQWGVRLTAHF